MRNTIPLFALAPLLALAACSGEDRRAGGTTASEARALDDAAEMLEERQVPAGTVPGAAPTAAAPAAAPPPTATPSG